MPPVTAILVTEQGIITNPGGTESEIRIDLESAQGVFINTSHPAIM